jgi:signal transduction histidine kinase
VERFRKQLVLASTTIVLVIVLGAVTGIVALRSSVSAQAEARGFDRQILVTERLRERAREIASAARNYMMSGDHEEQQRVLAIIDELKRDRALLDARFTLPHGPSLEAHLDEYQLAIIDAMADFNDDPVERLTRFEDRLAKVRIPLVATFDDLIASERSRRSSLRSASNLGQSAQWTLLLASAIGVMLAIGVCVTVLRRISRVDLTPRARSGSLSQSALLREPFDVMELLDEAIAEHRPRAAQRGLRMRFEPQPGVIVLADRERVREVLDGLLEAAILDGSPSSELVVHVGSGDGGIRVAVIEPGPGCDTTAADPVALLACRQIIEAHGGRLGVQSSSISRTYWFTIPGEPALLR